MEETQQAQDEQTETIGIVFMVGERPLGVVNIDAPRESAADIALAAMEALTAILIGSGADLVGMEHVAVPR